MKTLVLFQSGLLMAVFIMLNLPPDLSGFSLPGELALMRGQLVAAMRLILIAGALWFLFRAYLRSKKTAVPGAVAWSAMAGPIAAEVLAAGRPWFKLDPAGVLLATLFTVHVAVVISRSVKRYGLVRLVFYTAVYAASYVEVMYVSDGENSWLLVLAALAIVAPEIIMAGIKTRIRQAV